MKILYAEDEENIQSAVCEILKHKGYEIDCAADGEEAVRKSKEFLYDMILLDLMMPKMDGFEAIKKMRENQVLTPVIILSAMGELDDKQRGFDLGADDYIVKPINMRELLMKIESLHRRNTQYQNKRITCGNTTIDKTNGRMYSSNGSVSISKTETDIFKCLARVDGFVSLDDISIKIGETKEKISLYAEYLQSKLEMIQSDVRIIVEGDQYGFNREQKP